MSDTTLVDLAGAGHNTYQDRPAEVMAETRAFLTGARLPIAAYRDAQVPTDYQTR